MFIYMGARIGYWRGDIKGLVDDIGGWPHDGMVSFQRIQQEECRRSRLQESGMPLAACLETAFSAFHLMSTPVT